jgi:hypothetical protein
MRERIAEPEVRIHSPPAESRANFAGKLETRGVYDCDCPGYPARSDPTSPSMTSRLNSHRAHGTDGAPLPAISCLGAFPTPAARGERSPQARAGSGWPKSWSVAWLEVAVSSTASSDPCCWCKGQSRHHLLSAEIPTGEEQRGSFATAVGQFGVHVRIPSDAELVARVRAWITYRAPRRRYAAARRSSPARSNGVKRCPGGSENGESQPR